VAAPEVGGLIAPLIPEDLLGRASRNATITRLFSVAVTAAFTLACDTLAGPTAPGSALVTRVYRR
jgi:hypothetical protein